MAPDPERSLLADAVEAESPVLHRRGPEQAGAGEEKDRRTVGGRSLEAKAGPHGHDGFESRGGSLPARPRERGGRVQAVELPDGAQGQHDRRRGRQRHRGDGQAGRHGRREHGPHPPPHGMPPRVAGAALGAVEVAPHPHLAQATDGLPAEVAALVGAPAGVGRARNVHAPIMRDRRRRCASGLRLRRTGERLARVRARTVATVRCRSLSLPHRKPPPSRWSRDYLRCGRGSRSACYSSAGPF